ncbi:ABC transporter substrate-binding protein [Mesorhizobium sp. B2-6-5]|uniref:ABC transporter substrate-binding protein n=1 Tax=Mesorhizobium sp. B2-6-5 TaxID=2589912 RepID=UPI00112992E5|nr:ABC transporter substrate-binding protein [Mesorhizobium sp. B2-6-5]TPJ38552.1 ABC transporter substrate-binding protein [Mesorhizobium sp. B2-6-5]
MRIWRLIGPMIVAFAITLPWQTGAADAKTPDNVLVVAQDLRDLITLDPSFTYEPSGIEIINNLYDALVTVDPAEPANIVPGVAERWEVSSDGSQFTFFLREGLKFQSGNPVTAADVVFSFRRIIEQHSFLTSFTDRLGWNKDNLDQAVRMIDPMTVRLTLFTKISPSLALANLGTVVSAVLDSKLVLEHQKDGDVGQEWLKTHSAGSGPFSLVSYTPSEGIVLQAYPGYRKGAPAMERIVIRHIPEPSAQRLLLESGDVDVARDLSRDQLDAMRQSGKANVQIDPKLELIYLDSNAENPMLAHPMVREALRYLIDYQGISENLLRGEVRISQTFWPYGKTVLPNIYKLDVERARTLLKAAGYGDGFKIKMDIINTTPWTLIAQSIQKTMAEANIEVEITESEKKAVFGKRRARDYDLMLISWTGDYMDPETFSTFFWSPDNRLEAKLTTQVAWRARWSIPDLSILAELARAEIDPDKRDRMYESIQYTLQQKSPFVFMFFKNQLSGVAGNVNGFKPLPSWGGLDYFGVQKQ